MPQCHITSASPVSSSGKTGRQAEPGGSGWPLALYPSCLILPTPLPALHLQALLLFLFALSSGGSSGGGEYPGGLQTTYYSTRHGRAAKACCSLPSSLQLRSNQGRSVTGMVDGDPQLSHLARDGTDCTPPSADGRRPATALRLNLTFSSVSLFLTLPCCYPGLFPRPFLSFSMLL